MRGSAAAKYERLFGKHSRQLYGSYTNKNKSIFITALGLDLWGSTLQLTEFLIIFPAYQFYIKKNDIFAALLLFFPEIWQHSKKSKVYRITLALNESHEIFIAPKTMLQTKNILL